MEETNPKALMVLFAVLILIIMEDTHGELKKAAEDPNLDES